VIKWKRVQWAGQVASLTNEKCILNLIENIKGFCHFGNSGIEWSREIVFVNEHWIQLP
jgi:ribosomal protein S1